MDSQPVAAITIEVKIPTLDVEPVVSDGVDARAKALRIPETLEFPSPR